MCNLIILYHIRVVLTIKLMKLKECLLLKFLYIKKYNSLKSYIRKQQTINTTIISTSTSIQILQIIPINLERYENVFSMC